MACAADGAPTADCDAADDAGAQLSLTALVGAEF
jgi:hypothetical protein